MIALDELREIGQIFEEFYFIFSAMSKYFILVFIFYIIDFLSVCESLFFLDRQLEFINPDLARIAGESTYCYLSRIRRLALPGLSEKLVERIGFLAEHCRYRAEVLFNFI